MEIHHVWWVFPLKVVIFHSYVSLPEGIYGYQLVKHVWMIDDPKATFLGWVDTNFPVLVEEMNTLKNVEKNPGRLW